MEIVEVEEKSNFVVDKEEGQIYSIKEMAFPLLFGLKGKNGLSNELGTCVVNSLEWFEESLMADVITSSCGAHGNIIFRTDMIEKVTVGFGKVVIHFKEA